MYTPTQRLMRSRTDKIIAGVAGGIGAYLAVDPVIIRLALIALCFTGVGVLLYPLLWLAMPLEGAIGAAPSQAMHEWRQQAQHMGEELREVLVAPGSRMRQPRFDPMTGQPLDNEDEIPINNLNTDATPADPQARRNRLLGLVLLGIGGFLLIALIPGFGHLLARFLFPIALIIGGIVLVRRNSA